MLISKQKRDTLTLRLRSQIRQEFQDRETNFMRSQAQILGEERSKMEDQIRKFQEESALISQKANIDVDAAIKAIQARADQSIQEARINIENESKRREQQLLEKLRGAEEDIDTIRRGSHEYAEALRQIQAEAKQARLEAEEARAEAEMMRLKLMQANARHGLTEVCRDFLEKTG